ncbi:MAG: site-specific DNA-methyltransferase [Phycisphaerae bacterium]|nr:site-specific DNA-methyltransferase [Phycisphaerae bacterium]
MNRVHLMDALEGLKALPDESVDLVITDPPYNIAKKGNKTILKGKRISTMEAWGAWDHYHPYDYDAMMMRVIGECWRILKPRGALYMFTAPQDNGVFVRHAVARGFTFRSQVAMVKKTALPSIFRSAWRSAFEVAFYATKGAAKSFNFLEQAEMVNVYHYPTNHKHTAHPTEKPQELIERFVRVSSKPGDLILDPFMGSGTTAVAAKKHGRRFIGFERSPDYLAMAEKRLKELDHPATTAE